MKVFRLVVVVGLLGASAGAQERITLTAPETAPNNLKYRVARLEIDEDDPDTVADEGRIMLNLIGVERRVEVTCIYRATTSPTGTFLINALNKADLSSTYNNNATTGTLKQRIFHRLVIMNEAPTICGKSLAGTLTGTPQ